jgi:LL-diaminopimelate aminotransferase
MTFSERVNNIPPYIFARLEQQINKKRRDGKDLISLSIGDPDIAPPSFLLEELAKEAANPLNHNYSQSQGELIFREAVANWYKNRFKVEIEPESEVTALIGAKEGLANFARAFLNPGEKVLTPEPAYPVYRNGASILSGGMPITMPLQAERDFKPDLESFRETKAKMMFLNYPNNPTGAVANKDFLREVVSFAQEENIIVCYDNSYSEITYDGFRAPSILEIEGAREVAIEINSCSKAFNMTGDRIGFAVGNEHLITGLKRIKSQIDSGPSVYVQKAAIKALDSYATKGIPEHLSAMIQIYLQRRNLLVTRLQKMGFKCKKPKGTFYIWLKIKESSMDFFSKVLDAGVIITPGIGFGENGENYVRFSLTCSLDDINEACERMSGVL